MNATITSENAARQPHQPRYLRRREDPLHGAMIAAASMKLHLRRLRRDLVGSHRLATVDRLLDANAAVARSLEWLNGKAEATRHDFEPLEQFAIGPGTLPDAVGVSQ